MNKKHLLKFSALFLSALAWSIPADAEEHAHEHGENCTHQHSHEHTEEKHNSREVHKHVHGENCDHAHALEEQVKTETEHRHAHNENCTHVHEHSEGAHHYAGSESGHEHGSACTHDHTHENARPHAHDHEHGETCSEHVHASDAGTPVKISDRARQSIAMRFEKISDRPISETRSYYGQMIVPAEALKTGALPAAGRVRFFVKPGQDIVAGTPLFALASPELITLQSDKIEAEANLSRAEANLSTLEKRLEKLAGIGTKNSSLENEADFLRAEIPVLKAAAARAQGLWQIATLGGNFRDGILTVYSAFSGNVQSLDLTEGAWGEQGASALTLVVPQALEFKGIAFGNDSFVGKKARLAVTVGDEIRLFEGTLRISAQIDETTQARTIYFVPARADAEIYPGQVARLEVFTPATEAEAAFIPVPSSAVVKVGVDDIVFVCSPDDANLFFARKVETLPARRGITPVKGVRVGETVVSKGGYELKYILPVDGNAPRPKTAGHFHADGKFHEGEH